MARNTGWRLATLVMVLAGCSEAASPPATDPAFEARWRDGRAELNAYRLVVHRYGAPRTGQAVLVYVTEPFSARDRVKVDDPAQRPGDVLDVLKLNVARDFQTGIYDYNTMVSTFVRVADLSPLKVSFTSTEWCGNVHEELRIDPGRIHQRLMSYFEGESGDRTLPSPAGGVLEDELMIRVRGLHGDWLKPGEKRSVPLLEGAFWRRLAHRPATWTTAEIERLASPGRVQVPAGTFATTRYVVRVGGREGEFDVERDDPHRIVRWSWKPVGGSGYRRALSGLDSGELTGSRRLAYWQLNGPGDERYLDSLGIAPIDGGP